jgi:alpha-L-rhamnosidase
MYKKASLSSLFIIVVVKILAQNPINLKTEYSKNPLGIDVTPRFSWQIKASTRNAKQTAYQILVASTEALLKKDQGDMWASGKVQSDQQLFVEYKGKPLASRQRCYWKVKIWNEKAKASIWSEVNNFEMGLLKKEDWTAHWIGMQGTEGKPPKAVDLQKDFKLRKRAIKARVYVTGLGAYVVNFNGKKLGNDLLTPGWTHYTKSLQYQVYELDPEDIGVGDNFLSATVGNGWWASGLGWGGGQARYSEGPNRLLFQMEFTFYDGSIQIINSDSTWQARLSPTTANSLYGGESYDARLEYNKDWKTADILDNTENKTNLFLNNINSVASHEADVFSTKNIVLRASPMPEIQVTQELKAVKITEVRRGRWVFDFGQNLVGYCKLSVTGKAGKEIEMKFAELIDAKGFVDQANLRDIRPTDRYILKGYGTETWQPNFTYHGFRYVEVGGLPSKPDANTLIAKVIHNNTGNTGSFRCSNELLNKIQQNITWSQRGNMMSVPTDCPQRDERLGWMGDAQIFAPTAIYNMDMNAFFAKWMTDIAESQHSSGMVYNVNPKIAEGMPGAPAWGDAVVVIPYLLYQHYADRRVLDKYYPAMKAWVEYMNKHPNSKENGLYHFQMGPAAVGKTPFYGYGDWVAVQPSPTKPIGSAYQIYANKLLAEIAGIIGNKADQSNYNQIAETATKTYNQIYYNNQSKNYEGATQTANLIPLAFGIAPKADEPAIAKNITENVAARNNHISTGFIGTQMLLPTLSQYGQHELAYTIATQTTYPSWGYMLEKGATTMWELWNSDTEKPEGMNSRNHFAYGSVGQWYYNQLAGIQQDKTSVGYRKLRIAPLPVGNLTWAEGNYNSPYGNIHSRWERTGNKIKLNVEIPAGCTATVELPTLGNAKASIKESGKAIKPKSIDSQKATIELGSGIYILESH